MRISPTKFTFFLGKNFGDTRHPYEKNEPTLDHAGGVHGKACWLIAYMVVCIIKCSPCLTHCRRDFRKVIVNDDDSGLMNNPMEFVETPVTDLVRTSYKIASDSSL